jgi:hypothetical protein
MDDDALATELALAAHTLDPVPARLMQHAIAAYAIRSLDTDLAELIFDSLADNAQPVRSGEQSRLLTFTSGEVTIEVEVTRSGPTLRLIGQLLPAGPAEIDIRGPQRTVTVMADALGRFSSADFPAGPFNLRLRGEGGDQRDIVTDWVIG